MVHKSIICLRVDIEFMYVIYFCISKTVLEKFKRLLSTIIER